MTKCSVTDFHTHVLPGIDDGSASVEQSLEMLRMLEQQGVSRVIAVPHFYANYDTPDRFLRKRAVAIEDLKNAIADHPELPELRYGAEVYYFNGMSECNALPELAITGTRCLLVEMPMPPWSDQMLRELREVHDRFGLVPVIAHIDRYIRPFRTYGLPERLTELPVLVQANASFFIQRFTRPMALRMLKNGHIHLLGSDCHNVTTRKPNLGEALEIISSRAGTIPLEQMAALEAELLNQQ